MVRMPYLVRDRDRHGNVRIYVQRPRGRKVRIRAAEGTAEFAAAYAAAVAATDPAAPRSEPSAAEARRERVAPPRAGTLRWLVVEYKRSAAWRELGPGTRRTRELVIDGMLDEPLRPGSRDTFAAFPVDRLGVHELRVLRDRKAEHPDGANNRVRALRGLTKWAARNQRVSGIASDHGRDLEYLRPARSGGWHTWTEADLAAYEARWPLGTRQRLALAVLLYTGQRRSDVVRLGRQHVREIEVPGEDGRKVRVKVIRFTQVKNATRRPVTLTLPVLPELESALAAGPAGDLTWLVSAYGRPYTADGFGIRFRAWCDAAGLPHCSAHGLRKAGATRAAERGATPHQLNAIFGWRTLAQAETYTAAARQQLIAAGAMPLLATPDPPRESPTPANPESPTEETASENKALDDSWCPRRESGKLGGVGG